MFVKPTTIAADTDYIGYTETMWIHYDNQKVSDFIREWKNRRAHDAVVPVRSKSKSQ
jgi:hypothetical protein